MYFRTKNTLKNNLNYTHDQSLKTLQNDFIYLFKEMFLGFAIG